jgi:ABC-2 type transport system ATP-binding protein
MATALSPLLQASSLRKSYGRRLILNGVNLKLNAGEIVGLLGPNGAGKTTTLSILATLVTPDSGEIRIAGELPARRRQLVGRLGFVPQAIALYPSLSGFQNLEIFARMHRLPRRRARSEVARVLAEVGLADRGHDPVAVLSGGMQRRLNLACGMVHRPNVLLLDEPTVGVDPQSREQILEAISRVARAGAAIVYSTHYMEEIERICSRAYLIDRGVVIASGTIPELIAMAGGRPLMELCFRNPPPPHWFDEIEGITTLAPADSDCRVRLQLESLALVNLVLERSRRVGVEMIEFSVHNPNLSDAFMTLTGHALRDAP